MRTLRHPAIGWIALALLAAAAGSTAGAEHWDGNTAHRCSVCFVRTLPALHATVDLQLDAASPERCHFVDPDPSLHRTPVCTTALDRAPPA